MARLPAGARPVYHAARATAGARRANSRNTWGGKVVNQLFKIGDRVQYARTFLRATGQLAGDAPHASGRVISLQPISAALDLAVVAWDRPGIAAKVLTSNLVHKGKELA